MKLLAIDTATLTASVAVVDVGDDAVMSLCERAVSTHSDVLLGLIDDALGAASLSVGDLDGVAVGAGPGSFTGLRIGLATAKGLCIAEQLPLRTASSLAALAMDAGVTDGVVAAVLDAKKDEVFVGCFAIENGAPRLIDRERVMRPTDAPAFVRDVTGERSVVALGTGVIAYASVLSELGDARTDARATPSAASIARLAARGEPADLATAAPTYIRLSEAELKWRKHIP